jgi:hypothetical protein
MALHLPYHFCDQASDPVKLEQIIENLSAFEQIEHTLSDPNLLLNTPSIRNQDNKKLLLIGGAPSVRENLNHLNDENYRRVFTGGSVKFLGESDLTKPRAGDIVFLSNPQSTYDVTMPANLEGVDVIVATHCTPETFSALQSANANIIPFNGYIKDKSPDSVRTDNDTVFNIAYSALPTAFAMMVEHFDYTHVATLGWDGGDMNDVDPVILEALRDIHKTGNPYHYGNEPMELAMALEGIKTKPEITNFLVIEFISEGQNTGLLTEISVNSSAPLFDAIRRGQGSLPQPNSTPQLKR